MAGTTTDLAGSTPVDPAAPGRLHLSHGGLQAAGVLVGILVTSAIALSGLVTNLPLSQLLAVGICISAIAGRPRAVLGVGVFTIVVGFGLGYLTPSSTPTVAVVRVVTAVALTAVSMAFAQRRMVLQERQQAVQRQHAQLAAVVDSCQDGIVGMDLDGTVRSWNRGAERQTGWSAADAVGRPIAELGPAGNQVAVAPKLRSVRDLQSVAPEDTTVARRDGTPLHLSTMWSPIREDGEGLTGASLVFRDSGERERDRRALQDRVSQFERLESLGKLVGGVAHDFNNLMAIVLNYTEFVEESTRDNTAAQADLAHVRGAAERAAALTKQLLTFARGTAQKVEVFQVNEAVRRLQPMLGRTIGEDIDLRVRTASESTAVNADVGRLEQVLVNLAVNARDAMPNGGTLTVETRLVELDAGQPGVTPPPAEGRYVLLAVSDTGSGMKPEIVAHVFEPFFSTKGPTRGTGLGLATVWGIVTDAGGSITVYSEPGTGTTFKIYLPLAANGHGGTVGVAPRAPGPVARGSVLVVEDEDPLRDMVVRVLERSGYTVTAAPTGNAAIEIAAGRRFDLLLSDVIMPGLSGPDAASRIQEGQPDLPVLFMSGYSDGVLGPQGLIESGIDLVSKPFTRAVLLERVARAMGHDRARSRPEPASVH